MLSLRLYSIAFISTTFVVALLLAVYPLPLELRWWRPEFVLIMTIYWISLIPTRTSLAFLCLLGLFQDLLEGVPFGQHGLGLVIVAYICLLSYQRVRNYSIWQQSCWIFVLVGIAQLTDNWVQAMGGRPLSGIVFLYPAFASACIWPLCYLALNYLRIRYRVL